MLDRLLLEDREGHPGAHLPLARYLARNRTPHDLREWAPGTISRAAILQLAWLLVGGGQPVRIGVAHSGDFGFRWRADVPLVGEEIGDDAIANTPPGATLRLVLPIHIEGLAWNEERKRLYACDCAEHSLSRFESVFPDDARPRKAIETARLFARGETTSVALLTVHTAARWAADRARDRMHISQCGNDAAALFASLAASAVCQHNNLLASFAAHYSALDDYEWQRRRLIAYLLGKEGDA